MKAIFFFVCILSTLAVTAQGIMDTQQVDTVVMSRAKSNLLLAPFENASDTLGSTQARIDSICNRFNLLADSINKEYKSTVSRSHIRINELNRGIDSLRGLNLPTAQYAKKLDSLQHLLLNIKTKYSSKLQALKAKTTERLNQLDLPEEYKEPLRKLSSSINGLDLESDFVRIPDLKIPGSELPKIMNNPQMPSLKEIDNTSSIGGLPKVEVPTGDVGNVTQQIEGYQDDIEALTSGKLSEVKSLPETIESQTSNIEGIDELQKQSGIIEEHKAKIDDFKDPAKAKEKAVEIARKAAVDHFADKQEQLKSAMEKISKYKLKYSSISSIKDLPKRAPNPMKEKPFIERLTPGIYFQYQQKIYYLLDVNPYVGYKLSGRFTAGLGWNHRLAWDSKYERWNKDSRIFGPRTYVDFKLGKGFVAHVEGESMNSFVPSTLHGNPDAGQREWIWGVMTGIKKEYKIFKNLKGTAVIQYNLFNRHYKAPYVDRLNSRIGFEYTIKKPKRTQERTKA